jgi:hypothetical protein
MSHGLHCWLALFVVMAIVAGGCSSSSPPPISVSLFPSSPQAIVQSQTVALTATINNDRSSRGVLWSMTGPGSLSSTTGLSVTYNPPTSILASAQQVTVTVTSVADRKKSVSLQITVNPCLQIPNQAVAEGWVGSAYSQMLVCTGGLPPFQWSVYNGPIPTGWKVGGSLPDGLKMDPNTGTIRGTPTGAGTWYFSPMITDAASESINGPSISIQINPTAPPGNPVPFLNQPLVPTAVSPGNPGFTLSVSGTGFVSGATVDFDREPLVTTFVDSEHLTARVPAADVVNSGTASVTVVNPGPHSLISNVVYFHVAAPEPKLSFANAANSPLEIDSPYAVMAIDVNEDGNPDLVVTAHFSVYVFLGNGDGTFAPAEGSPMRVPSPPYDDLPSPYIGPLAVGDFNNSGHLGLAVGEFNNEAAVILLGNGDGTLVASSATFVDTLGFGMSGIETADFNADGNLDLAITNETNGLSPVALGYGNGAFTAAGNLNSKGIRMGVAVGDFNADGKLDAAVVSGGSTTYPDSGVSISLGKGDGTFTPANDSPISIGSSLSAIATADFNGDGRLDLAVTDSVTNTVTILLWHGKGMFVALNPIPVRTEPTGLVAGDFNADGKLDLAVANYEDGNANGSITLLLGNGDGTFTQASGSPYSAGSGTYQITAADFNGDGKLDLAVTTDGSVTILLQQ